MKNCKHVDCKFRDKQQPPTCNYFLDTGKPRGCKISEFDKYEPKTKKRRGFNKVLFVGKIK